MMTATHKHPYFKYFINIAFIALFVIWLSKIDIVRLQSAVEEFHLIYALCFCVSYVFSYACYAKKYQILFNPIERIGFFDLFFLICSGSYANFIVPTSGELLKIYVLKKQKHIPPGTSLVIILLERILALVVFVLLICVLITGIDLGNLYKPFHKILFYLIASCGGLIVAAVAVVHKKNKFRQVLARLIRSLPFESLKSVAIDSFNTSEDAVKIFTPKTMAGFVLFAVIKYLFDGFRLYFVLKIIGYDLAYIHCLVGNVLIHFLIMIPILPGSFGTFEFINISILHYLFGVPLEINLLEIFLERILSITLLFALGIFSFNHLNISKRHIRENVFEKELVPSGTGRRKVSRTERGFSPEFTNKSNDSA